MAETLPCSAFHYYDGPNPSYDTSPFTIHCTLEKGAEAYYSGIRVVVIAEKTGYNEKFSKAKIQSHNQTREITTTRTEQPEDKDLDEAVNNDTSSDGLPTYTLILELVDTSSATLSGADIIYQTAAETSETKPIKIPETHRIIYQYEKRTTVHSSSCVLLLATRHVGLRSRRRPKQNYSSGIKPFTPPPVRMGPPTHGFRILPPSESRPHFIQPPPEIMYNIFSILARDRSRSEDWRRGLVSVSLVCRTWWESVLCIVYEDFDLDVGQKWLDIGRLATVLKANPMWSLYIKRFSHYCFTQGISGAHLNESALTILKTAFNMRVLTVGKISSVLVEEFVEAFCNMTELWWFTQFSVNSSVVKPGSEGKTCLLNAAQLAKCFAHWPKLRWAVIIGSELSVEAGHAQFPPAQCALEEIRLECAVMSIAFLRAVTASSQETLQTVALESIRGINNKELTSWLLDFGPNLTSLTIRYNNFARSEDEELALDETISRMSRLSNLQIDGSTATVLTLLRYEPSAHVDCNASKEARCITIRDLVSIDFQSLVMALRTTKWKIVDITEFRVSDANSELLKELKKVVSERRISLRIRDSYPRWLTINT